MTTEGFPKVQYRGRTYIVPWSTIEALDLLRLRGESRLETVRRVCDRALGIGAGERAQEVPTADALARVIETEATRAHGKAFTDAPMHAPPRERHPGIGKALARTKAARLCGRDLADESYCAMAQSHSGECGKVWKLYRRVGRPRKKVGA